MVRDRVVVRPADDRHLPRVHAQRRLVVGAEPGAAPQHRKDGQRRLVLDPQRPRWVQQRAEEERPPRARTVEQRLQHVHTDQAIRIDRRGARHDETDTARRR